MPANVTKLLKVAPGTLPAQTLPLLMLMPNPFPKPEASNTNGPFTTAFSEPLLRPTPKRDTIVTFALVLSFWLVGFVLGVLAYASYIERVAASLKPSIEIVP